MKTLMMFLAMGRGQKAHISAGIAVTIFLFLCSIGIIIGGARSGYIEWVIIGLIWAIINALTIAILIFINIRRNTGRW